MLVGVPTHPCSGLQHEVASPAARLSSVTRVQAAPQQNGGSGYGAAGNPQAAMGPWPPAPQQGGRRSAGPPNSQARAARAPLEPISPS